VVFTERRKKPLLLCDSLESTLEMHNEALCSPGMLGDSRCLTVPGALGPVRGGYADPHARLCPLINVGGYIISGLGIAKTPYSLVALRLLDECPIVNFSVVRAVEASPSSGYYKNLLKQLLESKVIRVIRGGAVSITNSDRVEEDLSFARHPSQALQARSPIFTPRVCGVLRAVYKDSKGEARAIFDLVYTNKVSRDRKMTFSILGSAQLLDLVRTIDFTRQKYRFVHGDLKNAYYQLPIGPNLSRCCCVRMGDDLYEPLVLPMGFNEACGICQGIVFATILFRNPGEDPLGVDEAALAQEDAPAYVRLDDGGFICLVYDSFLVVTREDRAALWKDRLKTNFSRVNAMLKYLILEDIFFKNVLYCGIVFAMDSRGLSWCMEEESIKIWHHTARLELRPSPRTVHRLMGFLRFAAPILGWQHRALGKGTKIQSLLGKIVDWDGLIVQGCDIEYLKMLVLSVTVKKCHPRSHIPPKRGRSDAVFVAVDATPFRWVIVVLREVGGIVEIVKWDFNDFKADLSYKPHTSLEADGGVPIEVAEAIAMEFGLFEAAHHEGSVKVIGGDNLIASLGMWKGFSRSGGVQSVIDGSETPKDCPVIFVDIPTDENLADVKTRPKLLEKMTQQEIEDEVMRRKAASWKRLRDGYNQWKLTARTFFHRHDVYDLELASTLGTF